MLTEHADTTEVEQATVESNIEIGGVGDPKSIPVRHIL